MFMKCVMSFPFNVGLTRKVLVSTFCFLVDFTDFLEICFGCWSKV